MTWVTNGNTLMKTKRVTKLIIKARVVAISDPIQQLDRNRIKKNQNMTKKIQIQVDPIIIQVGFINLNNLTSTLN